MKKKFTVAVLGCGGRGACYVSCMKRERPDGFEVVALCDRQQKQLDKMHELYGLENTEDFLSDEEFLTKRRADALIIATDDRYHVPQGVKALEIGYDVLMEKPISDSREELELLLKTQQKTGGKVVICHELRYGAGYRKCAELLKNGEIGKLYAIDASERAVYWHWAQAYVRGIGSSLKIGHPAILAKCSHDLDLVQAYAGSECESVSSVGQTSFFKEENAPKGAAERCLDCKYVESCPYSAKRIYVDGWHKTGEPEFAWPYSKTCVEPPLTEEKIYEGIRTGVYGRCAFRCNTEQVDHQMVQMHFKNGVNASLKMAYGGEPGRRIVFYGTLGEIVFDERAETIELFSFGKDKQTIDLKTILEGGNSHGGGDGVLIREFYSVLTGEKQAPTPLKESVECHLMGIAAEESRKRGGELVKVHR